MELHPVCHELSDDAIGLRAFLVVDDTTLGPAAGGIRTRAYPDDDAARADAHALARAMTLKCSLAGLPCGGGKAVVRELPGMDRARVFERLGELVEELDGSFLTAGDLGTTAEDLAAVARRTDHVYRDEAGLAEAVGRGCLRAMEACARALDGGSDLALEAPRGPGRRPADEGARRRGPDDESSLAGLVVAVQGCGMVGGAVARAAAAAGARVQVADLDPVRARSLAEGIGAGVVEPETVLEADVDVLAPCAVGGVVTPEVAGAMRARALCGAANNVLAADRADEVLLERGVLHVPDLLASSGAVIEGIGRMLLGRDDCRPLIDRIRSTAGRILEESARAGRPAGRVARSLALARIAAAR